MPSHVVRAPVRIPNPPCRLLVIASAVAVAACGSSQPTANEPTVSLSLVSGQDQEGTVGMPLAEPIVAQLSSDAGHPVTGRIVSFTLGGSDGTIASASGGGHASGMGATFSVPTDDQGRAAARFTLGPTSGVQSIAVHTSYPVKGDSSLQVEALADPGGVARVLKSGDGQVGTAGQALPLNVAVVVTDRYGNALAGVQVVWTILAGGGSLGADTVLTDETGGAATQWTLGASAGLQQIVAQIDQAGSLTFSATAQ
jgi:hypothetical protein